MTKYKKLFSHFIFFKYKMVQMRKKRININYDLQNKNNLQNKLQFTKQEQVTNNSALTAGRTCHPF